MVHRYYYTELIVCVFRYDLVGKPFDGGDTDSDRLWRVSYSTEEVEKLTSYHDDKK